MGTGTGITPKAFILLSLTAAGPQGRATTVTLLVPQCSWHCGLLGLGEARIFSWDQGGQILHVHGFWGAHTPPVPSQHTSGIGTGDSPSTGDIAPVT